jgi:hypothetical protein
MAASQASPLTPEYISEYSGGQLIAVAVAFIPIITIFVALRVYSRRLTKAEWGLDDYIVLVSFVIQIGASALAICKLKSAREVQSTSFDLFSDYLCIASGISY